MRLTSAPSKKVTSFLLIAIVAVTFLAFYPSLDNDFVNFDDNKYVFENPAIMELSLDSIKHMFTSIKGQQYQYHPLTLLSFALDYHYANLDPHFFHRNNLILHLLNTLLVYWLIWALTSQWLVAALVSVLFGVHPMHVESVAWISERKDVLYSFFFLLSLILYVYYINRGRFMFIFLSFVMFLLSCLSKPMAITLPLILFALDYFHKRKFSLIIFTEKIPFFLLSAVFAFIATSEKYFPTIEFEEGFSWPQRFFIANFTFFQYTIKSVLPLKLSAFYPYPVKVNGLLPQIYYWAPALSLSLVTIFVYYFQRFRGMVFGGLFFVACMLPILNFYPLGNMLMADRYVYISYIGIFFIMARGLYRVLEGEKFSRLFKIIIVCFSGGLIIEFGAQTFLRCDTWQDSETLWSDVILKYPQEPLGYYNLASHYVFQGKINLAISEYTNAISVDPNYFAAHNNRGNMYLIQGKYQLALRDYYKALEIYPNHITSHMNLAAYYMYFKRYAKAIAFYERVLVIDPTHTQAEEKRYKALLFLKQFDEAIQQ